MLTLLLYVLIVGLVAALLFLIASAVFGRSEELGPLPEGTTATVLPIEGISGGDVRSLRFQQVLRGYKAGEVDWALARLAARIDELERQLSQAGVTITATHGNGVAARAATATPHGEYANGTGSHHPTPYVPAGATGYAWSGQAVPAAAANSAVPPQHPASSGQAIPVAAQAYPPGTNSGSPAESSVRAAPPAAGAAPAGQGVPAEWFAYGSTPATATTLGQDVPATPTTQPAAAAPQGQTAPAATDASGGEIPAPATPGVVPDVSTPSSGAQPESDER